MDFEAIKLAQQALAQVCMLQLDGAFRNSGYTEVMLTVGGGYVAGKGRHSTIYTDTDNPAAGLTPALHLCEKALGYRLCGHWSAQGGWRLAWLDPFPERNTLLCYDQPIPIDIPKSGA